MIDREAHPSLDGKPLLRIEGLNKSFGGLKAVSDVCFSVAKGELCAIIGPNGAGKTTLFNLITGYHRPDSGSILFKGKEISGMQPYHIVKLGIGRAFQRTNIFPRLTVLENLTTAMLAHRGKALKIFSSIKRYKDMIERSLEILESIGLAELAHRQSATLAHGNQKRLDIGIALALDPELVLLDEPTAGMSPEERKAMVELIQRLWRDTGVTLLFIEHDMDVVFGISRRLLVFHYGELIAEGRPEEISSNPRVIEAYLGEEASA